MGAIELARRGAEILVVGHHEARGAAAVEAIRGAGGSAEFFRPDMGDVADVCRIADAVLARSGSIDVLIHGARGMPPAGARARARESTAASPKTSSARSSSRASSKGCAPQKRDARAAESEPHKC
jgi:NAD(P)-dependent dehydrogenase (short-subunit alcohol dehydrogenase family)